MRRTNWRKISSRLISAFIISTLIFLKDYKPRKNAYQQKWQISLICQMLYLGRKYVIRACLASVVKRHFKERMQSHISKLINKVLSCMNSRIKEAKRWKSKCTKHIIFVQFLSISLQNNSLFIIIVNCHIGDRFSKLFAMSEPTSQPLNTLCLLSNCACILTNGMIDFLTSLKNVRLHTHTWVNSFPLRACS